MARKEEFDYLGKMFTIATLCVSNSVIKKYNFKWYKIIETFWTIIYFYQIEF